MPRDSQKSRDGQEVDGDGGGRTCPSDRCYWKSLDPDASCILQSIGRGRAVLSQRQTNVCGAYRRNVFGNGEVRRRGVLAIYVDDVLLAAEEAVAQQALQAISTVWECSAFERASVERAIAFCGFEIQANEKNHGGGFRLHQQKYEEELVNRWGVKKTTLQLNFKLPTPEEEANMERSEVRQAQACAGALLWLATRTRPCRDCAPRILSSPLRLASRPWTMQITPALNMVHEGNPAKPERRPRWKLFQTSPMRHLEDTAPFKDKIFSMLEHQ